MALPSTLVTFLSVGLSLASAAMFFLVARTVRVRQVSQESQRARDAFVAWWATLGVVTAIGVVLQLPAFPASVAAFLVVTVLTLALLCVGLWGLLFYLVFLFTNRRDLAKPLAVAYVLYFAFLTAFIFSGDPTHVESTKWGPELKYADPIDSGPVYWAAVLLLTLPPFLAAGGYLRLYWKVDQPVQKRRILLVSTSILVWFGSALVGTGAGSDSDAWHVISRLIGLGAAATIYYAYRGLKPAQPHPEAAPLPPDEPPLYAPPPRKGVSQVVPLAA